MSSSTRQTKKLSNQDIVDIYTSTTTNTLTSGFQNSTGDYVISSGTDLTNPYLVVQNDGTIVVSNNLVVKGNNTIANSFNTNADTAMLNIGLSNSVTINSMTQLTDDNTHALVLLDNTGSNLLQDNDLVTNPIYLQGVSGSDGINYSHLYPANSATNLVSAIIIPNSNIAGNNPNLSLSASSVISKNRTLLLNYPLNLVSSSQFRIGTCLNSSYVATSSSTTIDVNSTVGFNTSGILLVRNASSFGTLLGPASISSFTSVVVTIPNYVSSDFNTGAYIAAEDSNLNVFVLGALSNSASSQGNNAYLLNFTQSIKENLITNASKFYLLHQVNYTDITATSFIGITAGTIPTGLSVDTIQNNSSNRMQVYNLNPISNNDTFYFSSFVPSTQNFYVSKVSDDSNHSLSPSFDHSPFDLNIQLSAAFILQFTTVTPFTNNSLIFTVSDGVFGTLKTNNYNGQFGEKFNFINSAGNDVSKSILCGTGNSGTDTLYLAKTITDNVGNATDKAYFIFDYENNSINYANGVKMQNNTLNQYNVTASDSNYSGNMSIGGNLGVTGSAVIKSTLNVGGTLGVTGNTNLMSDLNVKNNSSIGGNLGVTGSAVIKSTLNVQDNTTIAGTLGVTGNTNLWSDLNVKNNSSIGGTLGVTGAVTLGSTLHVQGKSILDNDLNVLASGSVGGTLGVTGAVTLGSTLHVQGNSILDNNLNVLASESIGGTLGVTGAVILGSTLHVQGNSILDGTLNVLSSESVGGTLGVTGAVTLGSTLHVQGNSILDGTLNVLSSESIGGTLGVTGAVIFGSTLGVTGNTILGNNLNVFGNVGITGSSTFGGVVTITNNSQLSDTKDWQSGGAFVVTGDVGIGGDIVANGTGYFNGGSFSLSDQTLKTNIVEIDSALDKVSNLRGVYFNWIDTKKFNNKHQLGMIAQEVEAVVPELVDTSSSGIKSVNYAQITGLLIEAIKEQNNVIKGLKADIEILKTKKPGRKPKNSDVV